MPQIKVTNNLNISPLHFSPSIMPSPAGSFAAGWPFSHIVETYSWNTAYSVVEVALIVMVILCSYLVMLLMVHLKKHKQD